MHRNTEWGRRQGAWAALGGCRWLIGWLALAWACVAGAAETAPAPVWRLLEGELAAETSPGAGARPPLTGWAPVHLGRAQIPSATPALDRIVWYRFTFDLAAVPDQPLVLLVQRVVTTAEFRVNGSLLNPGVRFPGADGVAGTQMMNVPHWHLLPAGLLKPGRNEVLVRLASNGVIPPSLSGVSVGTADALRGEYLWRDIPQRVVPEALFALMLVSLVFGLRLWWHRRESLQAHLVATIVLWLATMALYLYPDVPLKSLTVSGGIVVLWVALHWSLLGLLWRLAGRPWRWFPRVLAIGSALPLLAALGVMLVRPSMELLGLLMVPVLLLRLLTTVMLLMWAWRERSWQAAMVTAAELVWFAGPVQTMLIATGHLSPDPFVLTPGDALPLYLAMMVLAAQRVVEERQEARDEAARQKEAAVAAERQRMMQDMHDGLGAHLVAAVRLLRHDDVPRSQVEQVVEEALADLRLIVDSLDPDAQSLQRLLGQWRHRFEPRLQALGLSLAWQVDTLPPHTLSPSQALEVLRFVQEATNNALRHARPTTIGIRVAARPDGRELRIEDDGVGIEPKHLQPGGSGHGLQGLMRRAQRLGAECEVKAGERGGTVVSLRWPARGDAPALSGAAL